MPFKSKKQASFLFARKPKVAREFASKEGSKHGSAHGSEKLPERKKDLNARIRRG